MTVRRSLGRAGAGEAAVEEAGLRLTRLAARGSRGFLELLREKTVLEVWNASRDDLDRWSGGRGWVERFVQLRAEEAAVSPPQAGRGTGWSFAACGQPGYPAGLLELEAPPAGLYVRGDPEVLVALHTLPRVTVVGTRRASPYGLAATTEIAGAFAEAGVCVLSGLALGTDGRAHGAALARGGPTAAVLGCGVDVVYPRRHRELYQRLVREGAVLSEYPPGTPPAPWTFPERNRLLAALGDAVVVVEAPERSGALITAHRAMDLGREVLAVPGPILGGGSDGCNRLLYDGAHVCVDAEAAVQDFLALTRMERRGREPAPEGVWRAGPAGERLTAQEREVLGVLARGPSTVDEVARAAGISVRQASVSLSILELERRVRRAGPGRYGLG